MKIVKGYTGETIDVTLCNGYRIRIVYSDSSVCERKFLSSLNNHPSIGIMEHIPYIVNPFHNMIQEPFEQVGEIITSLDGDEVYIKKYIKYIPNGNTYCIEYKVSTLNMQVNPNRTKPECFIYMLDCKRVESVLVPERYEWREVATVDLKIHAETIIIT